MQPTIQAVRKSNLDPTEKDGVRRPKESLTNPKVRDGFLAADYDVGPQKCANLQASCKFDKGGDMKNPKDVTAALLIDAKKYNPLFEVLLNWLKAQGEAKKDDGAPFTWTEPKVVTVNVSS